MALERIGRQAGLYEDIHWYKWLHKDIIDVIIYHTLILCLLFFKELCMHHTFSIACFNMKGVYNL